ncbi:transposase [Arenibacter sp. 6A1]|uniref:transposase n=1 Tax=Arenibacter sp. 6A1 TaxID=2720391 RepID=UPI001F101381|nr:transposase [Arenibacter sp. 6A1]
MSDIFIGLVFYAILIYSEECKKRLNSEFEKGKFSVLYLEKLHGVTHATIYRWIYKFSIFNETGFGVIEMKGRSNKKMKELEARVKELDRTKGRKQIIIDFLERMMDIAKEELDIDIKKKTSAPHNQLVPEKPAKNEFFHEQFV